MNNWEWKVWNVCEKFEANFFVLTFLKLMFFFNLQRSTVFHRKQAAASFWILRKKFQGSKFFLKNPEGSRRCLKKFKPLIKLIFLVQRNVRRNGRRSAMFLEPSVKIPRWIRSFSSSSRSSNSIGSSSYFNSWV